MDDELKCCSADGLPHSANDNTTSDLSAMSGDELARNLKPLSQKYGHAGTVLQHASQATGMQQADAQRNSSHFLPQPPSCANQHD
eukprot:363901-Chlamydomonas_euryale.AAC.27